MVVQSPEEIHPMLAKAFNQRDLDGYVQLYEQDATMIVPPEGRSAHGKTEIRAAVEATFALKPVLRVDVVATLRVDGVALSHARWKLSATDAGQPVEMSGRGTLVSRRQPDGSWLIAIENTMSPD